MKFVKLSTSNTIDSMAPLNVHTGHHENVHGAQTAVSSVAKYIAIVQYAQLNTGESENVHTHTNVHTGECEHRQT